VTRVLSEFEQPIEELLAQIGLHPNFTEGLLREDDWSLVIKLHALFESLVGNLILEELGRSELNEAIANMGFNVSKCGKVDVAQALGLLTKSEKVFLKNLSELRNLLVHNIDQTSFKFAALEGKGKVDFFKKFASPSGRKDLQLNDPKCALLVAAHEIMLGLYYKRSKTKKKLLIAALRKQ
jgi:hypothetical protein